MSTRISRQAIRDWTILGIFVLFMSFLNSTWREYPRGNDALGHLSKIQFIISNWPNISWAHIWYAGIPLFRWYGPVPEVGDALIARFPNLSIPLTVIGTFMIAVAATTIILYETVLVATKDRFASILTALLIASTSIFWGYGIIGGFYPRIIAVSFLSASIYFLLKYFSQRNAGVERRTTYLGIEFFASLTIVSHPLIGAIGVFLIVILTLFCARGRGFLSTLLLWGKLLVPIALISSWFVLPFVYNMPTSIGVDNPFSLSALRKREGQPFPLNALIFLMTRISVGTAPSHLLQYTFSPLIVPLFLGLALFSIAKLRTSIDDYGYVRYILRGLVFVSLFFLTYVCLGADTSYLLGLLFCLPMASGIMLHRVGAHLGLAHIRAKRLLQVLLVLSVLVGVFAQYGFSTFSVEISEVQMRNAYGYDVISQTFAKSPADSNSRFAVPSDAASSWFNYVYDVPQTRGYYGQGVVEPDRTSWFETVVWGNTTGIGETEFALDWFAVKWLIAYPPYNYSKFLSNPALFHVIANQGPVYGFVRSNPCSIISVTRTPSVLVVGPRAQSYNVVFAALSYSDFDSRHAITIAGHEYIDDYSLEDLGKFDVVFLYGFNFHDRNTAYLLLQKYVENGGGLVIETGYSPEVSSSDIPLPFPTETTMSLSVAREWDFTSIESLLTDGINFESFSPAVYGSGSWGVSTSANNTIRPWASPVLWSHGRPVVAGGDYGKGRVVWSGLNLPFHVISFKNSDESRFLGGMVQWASRATHGSSQSVVYRVQRESPQKILISSEGAAGVLFKEFYFANWNARIVDMRGDTRTLMIYPAGPDMMYVRLPEDMRYPVNVLFEYSPTQLEYLADLLSLVTLAILLAYALAPRKFDQLFGYLASPFRRVGEKAKNAASGAREQWESD